MERMKRWAGSRRGVCSLALAAVGVGVALRQGWVSVAQIPVAVVVILLGAAALVWVLALLWEDKMLPTTPTTPTTPARRFWWYRDGFAWENQGLEARDVMALLHAKDRRHSRQMETAHVLLDVEQGRAAPVPRQRQSIPREVQREVFTRDGGRCVECGSDFQIQYDHVIPHSLGGADTVQNLQLLCAPCNQSKGATF